MPWGLWACCAAIPGPPGHTGLAPAGCHSASLAPQAPALGNLTGSFALLADAAGICIGYAYSGKAPEPALTSTAQPVKRGLLEPLVRIQLGSVIEGMTMGWSRPHASQTLRIRLD